MRRAYRPPILIGLSGVIGLLLVGMLLMMPTRPAIASPANQTTPIPGCPVDPITNTEDLDPEWAAACSQCLPGAPTPTPGPTPTTVPGGWGDCVSATTMGPYDDGYGQYYSYKFDGSDWVTVSQARNFEASWAATETVKAYWSGGGGSWVWYGAGNFSTPENFGAYGANFTFPAGTTQFFGGGWYPANNYQLCRWTETEEYDCSTPQYVTTCDGHIEDGGMEQFPSSSAWYQTEGAPSIFGRKNSDVWLSWYNYGNAKCGTGYQIIGFSDNGIFEDQQMAPIEQSFCWPDDDGQTNMYLSFDFAVMSGNYPALKEITYTIKSDDGLFKLTEHLIYDDANGTRDFNDYLNYQRVISGSELVPGDYTISFDYLASNYTNAWMKLDNVQLGRGIDAPTGLGTCSDIYDYLPPGDAPACDPYDLAGMQSCGFSDDDLETRNNGTLNQYDNWLVDGNVERVCDILGCRMSIDNQASISRPLVPYNNQTLPEPGCIWGAQNYANDSTSVIFFYLVMMGKTEIQLINTQTNQTYKQIISNTSMGPTDGYFMVPSGRYTIKLVGLERLQINSIAISAGAEGSGLYPDSYPMRGLTCDDPLLPYSTPTSGPTPTGTQPTPTTTSTSRPTNTATPTAVNATASGTPTRTPTPSPVPSRTAYPTWTPTNTRTPGPPTATGTTAPPTNTPAPTRTPTETFLPGTSTPTDQPESTDTLTPTPVYDDAPTPTYVPPDPPQQPPPDCIAQCVRPAAPNWDTPYDESSSLLDQLKKNWYLIKYTAGYSVGYVAGWIDYTRCNSLSFIVWCPQHTEQIAAIPTQFANREPMGTINEVSESFDAVATVYNGYNWANSGVTINGTAMVSETQVTMAQWIPGPDSPYVTGGGIDITGQTSSITGNSTTECEMSLSDYVGPLLSAGMCFSITTAHRLGVLQWMQYCVNGLSVLILLFYLLNKWVNPAMHKG